MQDSIDNLTAAGRPPAHLAGAASPATCAARFRAVRAATLALAAPLSEADCQVQSMPDASPVKWHLAHVTWFFETFVLAHFEPGFAPCDPAFRVLFNSYYNGVGEQHPRAQRGLLTRPGLAAVRAYRAAVDERVLALLRDDALAPECRALIELGLQHEQQHQELLLTDVLHLLSCNPLAPVYAASAAPASSGPAAPLGWVTQPGGLVDIGHVGTGFAFDNESPRHRHWLAPYALADRLVTQGEWVSFIDDGGYRDPRWWLAAGWDWVRAQRIEAPLHWRRGPGSTWQVYTLGGLVALEPAAPVCHLSLYEADACARWLAAQWRLPLRLPSESEWESAATAHGAADIVHGNFVESGALRGVPVPPLPPGAIGQLFGDAWEWTSSSYAAYPGYAPAPGAVGEYNGKFMVNQYVLRGGSCATPRGHIRASYRNFFPAEARWQFSGLRLAMDVA